MVDSGTGAELSTGERVINVQFEVVQFEPIRGGPRGFQLSFGALPKTSVRGVSDTAICCWRNGSYDITPVS